MSDATVTGLREHPRRPDRIVVELGGRAAGAITLDLIAELRLKLGEVADGERLRALEEAIRRTVVLDRALDLLAVRARSARDLRGRLLRREASEGDVTWVLARLQAQGLVDDEQYARHLARTKLSSGTSRRRVQQELYRRGVAREVSSSAIEETLAERPVDEYESALEAGRKRIKALGTVEHAVRRRRLYGYLARRGFEPEIVSRVLRELCAPPGRDDAKA